MRTRAASPVGTSLRWEVHEFGPQTNRRLRMGGLTSSVAQGPLRRFFEKRPPSIASLRADPRLPNMVLIIAVRLTAPRSVVIIMKPCSAFPTVNFNSALLAI